MKISYRFLPLTVLVSAALLSLAANEVPRPTGTPGPSVTPSPRPYTSVDCPGGLFPSGTFHVLDGLDPQSFFALSPDRSTAGISGTNKITLKNLATNQEKEIKIAEGEHVQAGEFTSDGRYFVVQTHAGNQWLPGQYANAPVDSRTCPQCVSGPSTNRIFVQDVKKLDAPGKTLTFGGEVRGEIALVGRNAYVLSNASPSKKSGPAPMPSGVPGTSTSSVIRILDVETGRERVVPLKSTDSVGMQMRVSGDGRSAVFFGDQNSATQVDLSTGKEKTFFLPQGVNDIRFSQDRRKLVIFDNYHRQVQTIDVATGQAGFDQKEYYPQPLQFVPGRELAPMADFRNGVRETDKKRDFPILRKAAGPQLTADGKWFYSLVSGGRGSGALITGPVERACSKNILRVAEASPSAKVCRRPDGSLIPESELAVIRGLETGMSCSRDFKAAEWPEPKIDAKGGILSREAAEKYLIRFAKPGGFDPARHMDVLQAVLYSDLPAKQPKLVRDALQGVLHASNALYDELLSLHPELASAAADIPLEGDERTCLTSAEKGALAKDAKDYLEFLSRYNGPKTELAAWNPLAPLRPLLKMLPDHEREDYEDKIAQSLADAAHEGYEKYSLGTSALYYLESENVKPIFGRPRELLTNASYGRNENGRISPLIVSTLPIISTTDTGPIPQGVDRYGLHVVTPAEIIVPRASAPGTVLVDRAIDWTTGGKRFKWNFVAKTGEGSDMLPRGLSPDYESLWKTADPNKKELGGLVLFGENLGSRNIDQTTDEYLEYYGEQGFHFDPPVDVKNVREALKKWTLGGDIKYMIREAHTGGDQYNIIGTTESAKLRLGRKTLPDGRQEVIRILVPDYNSGGYINISHREMADWMRDRQSPLVFINSSCWSAQTLPYIIPAIHSSKFINIGLKSEGLTFGNEDSDAIQIMLNGIRGGKAYQWMRDELQAKDENYQRRQQQGHTGHDWYVFPDEPDYYRNLGNLATPPEISVRQTDESGNDYVMGHSTRGAGGGN